MTVSGSLLAEDLGSTSRQLLQYTTRNCDYYGNCGSSWRGGRIAGLIVGCVCFALAIFFAILAMHIRRRRRAQANAAYPVGTYPAGANQAYPNQPYPNQAYPNQAYPQANQYPQAQTYPNQAYPQNNEGFNPAAYSPAGTYPNTATGVPTNGYNEMQMSALPHEKPGHQGNV
ncbi:hypothetical protein ABBQ32_001702 [Trebouxia sp. C0010 RCD-2024]